MIKLTLLPLLLLSFFLINTFILNKNYSDSFYSIPNPLEKKELPKHIKRIVFTSSNDFHGSLDAAEEKIEDRVIKVGGAEIISSYVSILRDFYKDELLLLDIGDIYSGTMISNLFQGRPVVDFFNYLNYDATVLGNHEFDFGHLKLESRLDPRNNYGHLKEHPRGALKYNVEHHQTPFINSNVYDAKTKKLIEWKGMVPYLIKEANGVKIGFIGITTPDTPESTNRENVEGLIFKDMKENILRTSQILKERGSDIVVLLIHEGNHYRSDYKLHGVNHDPNDLSMFNHHDAIFKLTEQLPSGVVDIIFGGHSHRTAIHHYFNGFPYIQSFHNGRYMGLAELYYDTQNNKVITEMTKLHPPFKLCHEFFNTTNDCFIRREGLKFESLKKATFFGKTIEPDLKVTELLKSYREKIESKSSSVVGYTEHELTHPRYEIGPLGQLTSDAMKWDTKADFALMNHGGLRTHISKGIVTFKDIYKVAPFDNHIVEVRVTGKEVRHIAQIATSGHEHGVGYLSGLKVELHSDCQGDQNLERKDFECDKIKSITLEDGSPLNPDKEYSIVTTNFIALSGGDNFNHVFNHIPDSRKKVLKKKYRGALLRYFKLEFPVEK